MQNVLQIVYLIPLLPLIGFLINGLGRKHLSKSMISAVGCGTILISFALSIWVFLQVKEGNVHNAHYFDFISVGNPAPPRPRRPLFFTSSVTASGDIDFNAFSTLR